MIYFNKFDTAKGKMIAMCDEELMGNVYMQGKLIIDLKQYGGFYKGDLITEDDAKSQIDSKVYSANAVGERSVGLLLAAKLISKDDIKSIGGVKIVHLFKVDK